MIPLDNQSFQLFKTMLWNQPASAIATTCGNLKQSSNFHVDLQSLANRGHSANLSDVLNQCSRDCLCTVLLSITKHHCTKLFQQLQKARKTYVLYSLLILNVSVNQLLQTTMASNKLLTGNHLVVAVIDVCAETTYYCNPLRFPILINLSVETQQVSLELKRVLSKQMKMFYHTIAMHKPMFGPNGEHFRSRNCLNFLVQKCSSTCGIIVFTFVAISAFTLTNVWECICSPHMALNDVKSNLTLFRQASWISTHIHLTYARCLHVRYPLRLLT